MAKDSVVAYLLSEVQTHFDLQAGLIERLSAENKTLKDELHRDDEIARLQREVDTLRATLQRSFVISEAEEAAIDNWRRKHTIECHGTASENEWLSLGCVAGEDMTYEFTRTTLGDVGVVRCVCGESYCFHDNVGLG